MTSRGMEARSSSVERSAAENGINSNQERNEVITELLLETTPFSCCRAWMNRL
ncbi:putative U2 snRNP component ist3-like [Sesbania bispinosa]|nr:putative U2 snRNP component ist3-like [Sesbania bispinosa]